MRKRSFVQILILLILFFTVVFVYDNIKYDFYEAINRTFLIAGSGYPVDLPLLAWQHTVMSFWACFLSIIIGVSLGVFAMTGIGKEFRIVIEKLTSFSKSLPAIGLLAMLIPIFGFGAVPGIIVLVLGGVMPIVYSTIAGIANVPDFMLEVGLGLGMSRQRLFLEVQTPLAFPVLISGMRTASTIIIGGATLAAFSGSGGLGMLIISAGIRGFDPVMLMEGVLPISLMALIADRSFGLLEQMAQKHFGLEKHDIL
ncbi:MAG: ABC transporter permease [Peptococcaceae bacterium]|nr:ABC transporter permease [Peptococcaceae bacterium]